MTRTGKDKPCKICSKMFYVPRWREVRDAGYCSKECYFESKLGLTPWNKGTKGLSKGNSGSFKKGSRHPVTIGLKEYKMIHYQINKQLGKPKTCEDCNGLFDGKRIQWANKSGEYKLEATDWMALCVRCHMKYDQRGVYAR